MSEQTDDRIDSTSEIPDFLEAFNITYDPIKNQLLTSFGRMDATGKQYSGDLVVKAAFAKMQNLRPEIAGNARGRILLINGGASLAATQVITASVLSIVSAIAIRDPKLHSPENHEAYLVSAVTSTDKYSVGDILQIEVDAE